MSSAAAEPAAKGATSPSADVARGAGVTSKPAVPDAEAMARAHYETGRRAAAAKDWEGAYAAQRSAYALWHNWQIAGALGDAAFVLGKYPEAIEMLSQKLKEGVDLAVMDQADTQMRLAEARKRCGTIAVHAADGAEVRLDGASIGRAPLQRVVYALPGAHALEVVGPSGTERRTVEVTAGKEADVTVQTISMAPKAELPVQTAPVKSPASGAAQPSVVPVVVLGTAAGLGLIATGVLTGLAVNSKDQAISKRDALEVVQRPCSTRSCQTVIGLVSDHDTYARAALGVGLATALLGAATLGVTLSRSSKSSATTITLVPVITATGGGSVVNGTF